MNPQEFERFAVCDKNGFISFYNIEKNNNNISFSFIFKKKCHDSGINCILNLPDEEMLVSLSYENLIFWEIQNRDLRSLYEFRNNSAAYYKDSLLAIDGNLLVGEYNGIRVYRYDGRRISYSFFYKNKEFGNVYSIKHLGNNYFICGRSFGFCSIFLLRERTKNIRKINIFRNNNLRTSDEEFEVMNDNYLINNICVKRTSADRGNILVSSVDKTLKAYSYSFRQNDYIE